MAECMEFPETLDAFLEEYQFQDGKEVYTNGAMLIPVFRVKQWAEHIPAVDAVEVRHGEWLDQGSLSCRCSECGCKNNRESAYCPNCGAKMDGRREAGDVDG